MLRQLNLEKWSKQIEQLGYNQFELNAHYQTKFGLI